MVVNATGQEVRALAVETGRFSKPGLRRVGIAGLATHVPPRVLTNADLEKIVDTTDEWIQQRTGIRERHIVDAGIATSDLAKEASLVAIAQAGLTPADIVHALERPGRLLWARASSVCGSVAHGRHLRQSAWLWERRRPPCATVCREGRVMDVT